MLIVETIGRIRREHLGKGKSIKEISRTLHLSRNTVRRILRSGETAFAWIARRREAARQAVADATVLIAERGAGAYEAARRRERDALGDEEARRWRRVAVVIAKLTGRRIGLDAATRMTYDVD